MHVKSICTCNKCTRSFQAYDQLKEHILDGSDKSIEDLFVLIGSLNALFIAEFFDEQNHPNIVESFKLCTLSWLSDFNKEKYNG